MTSIESYIAPIGPNSFKYENPDIDKEPTWSIPDREKCNLLMKDLKSLRIDFVPDWDCTKELDNHIENIHFFINSALRLGEKLETIDIKSKFYNLISQS